MREQDLKAAVDRRLGGVRAGEAHIRRVLLRAGAKPRRGRRRGLMIALALTALLGTTLAATWPATVSWIQGMFGEDWANELKAGTLMSMRQSRVLGEVSYELLELIHVAQNEADDASRFHEDNSLFGSVRITPAEGVNIVLIPEDTELGMSPGFNRHLGEIAPEDAPSYLDLAVERDARIILATAVPRGILVDGRLQEGYEIMYSYSSEADGSLLYHFQIPMVEVSDEYTVLLRLHNWEIARDGRWLREGAEDTVQTESWVVTARPGE